MRANASSLGRVRCQRKSAIPARRIRLELRDPRDRTLALSNPIEIEARPGEDRLYWGDLHCHSDLEQGLDTPQFLYEYARVTQQDGEMAWTSPIWVTVGPG